MPAPLHAGRCADVHRLVEQRREGLHVLIEILVAAAADADVDVTLLAHAPGVSLEVVTEQQFRELRGHRAPVAVQGNSASFATTGTEVSGPRMCRATGQKWPPAPTMIGAST